MASWFRVTARTVAFRFPVVMGTLRLVLNKLQPLREVKNVGSLLTELHSDTALQLPLLVEQNRRMWREVEALKLEVRQLREELAKVTAR